MSDEIRWNAKHDAFKQTTDFSELLQIVSCYYEMYFKAAAFLGPYIAKQNGSMFLVPDKDQIKMALGKERPQISFRARSFFIDALINFVDKTRGKKALISPNPSSHHSAQFPVGTFEIKSVIDKIQLRDDKEIRKPAKTLHRIDFVNVAEPVYIENLSIPEHQIKFIIIRPKLGKLGTPSTSRWEVLLYKNSHGFLVEHVDSHLNPRWSGII
jgi:hypothetical protein